MSASRHSAAALALSLLLTAAHSPAQVKDEGSDEPEVAKESLPGESWSGTLGVGTDFPLDYAARFTARSASRLRGTFSMGYLPKAYVKAINSVVVRTRAYDFATAQLVEAALQSSFVVRSHIGYAPSPWIGLYGEVGYGFMALGGSVATAEVLSQVIKRPVPEAGIASELREFSIDTVLHQLDFEIGWEIPMAEHLELRPAIGAAITLAAQSNIEPKYRAAESRQVQVFTDVGEQYLNYVLTTYVHTPVASLSLGYSF